MSDKESSMTDETNPQEPQRPEEPGPGTGAGEAPPPNPAKPQSQDTGRAEASEAPKEEGSEKGADANLREPFPFVRLLFSVLFGIITWFAIWIVLLLAFLQYVTVAIAGEKNDELQEFSRKFATYMKQMFDYMMLASDERPFPFGPFPKE
jgi:hypothetical protein